MTCVTPRTLNALTASSPAVSNANVVAPAGAVSVSSRVGTASMYGQSTNPSENRGPRSSQSHAATAVVYVWTLSAHEASRTPSSVPCSVPAKRTTFADGASVAPSRTTENP